MTEIIDAPTGVSAHPAILASLVVLMTEGGFPTDVEHLLERADLDFVEWGLDSLAQLDLVIGLGSHYGLVITDSQAEELRRPVDVVRFVAASTREAA